MKWPRTREQPPKLEPSDLCLKDERVDRNLDRGPGRGRDRDCKSTLIRRHNSKCFMSLLPCDPITFHLMLMNTVAVLRMVSLTQGMQGWWCYRRQECRLRQWTFEVRTQSQSGCDQCWPSCARSIGPAMSKMGEKAVSAQELHWRCVGGSLLASSNAQSDIGREWHSRSRCLKARRQQSQRQQYGKSTAKESEKSNTGANAADPPTTSTVAPSSPIPIPVSVPAPSSPLGPEPEPTPALPTIAASG
jgi:hypothetical protein